MKSDSRKAIFAAFAANLGIAIAKLVGFFFTGAASMLAEAIHSAADTANQGLLMLGSRLARREANSAHPFGYGRERYFWAFIVALVIFSMGSLFALYEGISKVLHPHALQSPQWAVGILLVAILLEGWSFRTAVVEANRVRRGLSWWGFIRRSKVPELPVVLLEDFGALTGLCLALIGVGLATLTGDARFDAMGSVCIGVLLAVIALVLAIEMRSLLLGEGAGAEVREQIRRAVEGQTQVIRVIHMRTQHLGPDELLVAIKVELDAGLDFRGVVDTINDIEVRVRSEVEIARQIYIEPDVMRDEN